MTADNENTGSHENQEGGKKQSDYLKEVGLPQSKFMEYYSPEKGPTALWATKVIDRVVWSVPRWLRENVVKPNQQDYPYYHRQYRRVPTIDECYTTDYVCIEEANSQFRRDRLVEGNILQILGGRLSDCVVHHGDSRDRYTLPEEDPCNQIKIDYNKASLNFYIKFGDMRQNAGAKDALMKQKHRMVWERRNGEYSMSAQGKRKAAELAKEVGE